MVEPRSGTLRVLGVVALATVTACGGSSKELSSWSEPIFVSGTIMLELRPSVVIPSMWGQAAGLELCFEQMSSEATGQSARVAPSLDEPRFRTLTARIHTAGAGLHLLEGHSLVGRSFCLVEAPLVHGKQDATRMEITSDTPVALVGVRLRRVVHP